MMKKLLLLLILSVCYLAGSGNAWAEEVETLSVSSTSSGTALTGTCYSIAGTYNGGGHSDDKTAFKLKPSKSATVGSTTRDSTVLIEVCNSKRITGIAMTCSTSTPATIKAVYVDDSTKSVISSPLSISTTTKDTVHVSLEATSYIWLTFGGGCASQIKYFSITFTYENVTTGSDGEGDGDGDGDNNGGDNSGSEGDSGNTDGGSGSGENSGDNGNTEEGGDNDNNGSNTESGGDNNGSDNNGTEESGSTGEGGGSDNTGGTEVSNGTAITLYNAFNTTDTDQAFVLTPSDQEIFSYTGYTVAGLTEDGTFSVGDKVMKKFTNSTEAKISTVSADTQIEFYAYPKKGITFVVTGVSFSITAIGTSDPKLTVLIGTKDSYQTPTSAASIEQSSSSSLSLTNYSETGLTVTCDKTHPFSLCVRTVPISKGKSIAISDVTITGYYTGEPIAEVSYTVSATADEAQGTVSMSPNMSSQTEGSTIKFTATPNDGYKFSQWIGEDSKVVSTENPYTIDSLSGGVSLTAVFEKLLTVTYTLTESATGSVPAAAYYDRGATLTIPARGTELYLEGYTLEGWSDGTTTYAFGEEITITKDLTLTTAFVANAKSLAELIAKPRTENLTLYWTFNQNEGAPVMAFTNTTGNYVLTDTIAGQPIDLLMTINTTKGAITSGKNGKLDNSSKKTYAQTKYAEITIPVVAGGTVAFVSGGSLSGNAINGESVDSYNSTTDGNIYLTFSDDSESKLTGITVTYPANAYSVTVSDLGASTLCLPIATEVPSGVKAYTGSLSADQSRLTLKKVDGIIPAEEAVVIFASPGAYTFLQSAEEGTKDEDNSLVGNATDEAITPQVENATICVLSTASSNRGFYSWSGEIPAHKAYLPVPKATDGQAAPAIRIVFGDEPGNVTAIDRITVDNDTDAPLYNLAGQRVQGNVAPGLYIRGGKKVVVK
jgi:hypothetical protein